MHARERLYLTAERDRLVRHGDPKAAFLYAAQGDEIPQSAADRFGLVDGRLKPKATKPANPPSSPPTAPTRAPAKKARKAAKEQKPGGDKEEKPAGDKEQKGGEDKGG